MKTPAREVINSNVLPGKSIIISVMMTSFFTTFIGSSTNLALPLIGKEFAGSALVLSWIVTGYILASAVFLLPMGRIADIVGRKKIFLLGTTGFTLFTFLCAVSWSNASLILFRVLQGITASMIYATGMAMISSAYPAGQRGKAMGLAVTATYTGLSLGPALGGFICQHLGWRSIFYFTALVGLASVVFIITRVRDKWPGRQGEKIRSRRKYAVYVRACRIFVWHVINVQYTTGKVHLYSRCDSHDGFYPSRIKAPLPSHKSAIVFP